MAVPIHEFFYLYRYFISDLYIIILTFIFKKYDRVEKGKLSEIARATLKENKHLAAKESWHST